MKDPDCVGNAGGLHDPGGQHQSQTRSLSFPYDLLKNPAQPSALYGIDHLYRVDSALDVKTELGVRLVILCFRPASDAIGECGLQAIEVSAKNIRVSVGYESRKSLTNALTHDSRLAVMGTKAFFFQDCSHTG